MIFYSLRSSQIISDIVQCVTICQMEKGCIIEKFSMSTLQTYSVQVRMILKRSPGAKDGGGVKDFVTKLFKT